MSDSPNEDQAKQADGAVRTQNDGTQANGTSSQPAAGAAQTDRTPPADPAQSEAGTPGTAEAVDRKRPRRFVLPVVIVGLLALGAVVYYFYYQGANFVSTNDASVQGHVVYIYPPAAGTLEAWNVRLSQFVPAHAVLGTVRTPSTGAAPAQGAGASSGAVIGVPVTTSLPGVIVQNAGIVGEEVNPALGLPLAAEVDPQDLWIEANVQETDIGRVRVGQGVQVTVDALPGRVFTGHVAAIEQATQSTFSLIPASATSGTFTKVTQRIPVKIVLPETAGMAPGMSAEVRIDLH